jgi:hypothetical protein
MRTNFLAVIAISALAALSVVSPATASTTSETFSLLTVTTNSSHVVYSAIASGAFVAGGTAEKTASSVILQFPTGTVTLSVKHEHQAVTESPACLQQKVSSGAYTISAGTGSYKGISGSGQAKVEVTIVESLVNGKCATAQNAAQGIITASGPVTLP